MRIFPRLPCISVLGLGLKVPTHIPVEYVRSNRFGRALANHYFGESRVAGDVVGADHDQVFAGREVFYADVELFAGGIGDAIHGFDRHPGASVNRIFAAAEYGTAILGIDIDFDCRAVAARGAGGDYGRSVVDQNRRSGQFRLAGLIGGIRGAVRGDFAV